MSRDLMRDLAIQRMRILFRLGIEAAKRGEHELSKRYGELIKSLAMRTRARVPRGIRRWICKNCNAIMVPGYTARVRTRREGKTLRIVTTCLVCGWIHRYEFVKKRCIKREKSTHCGEAKKA